MLRLVNEHRLRYPPSMYEGKRPGPALGRLRRRKDLRHEEVASRLGLSVSSVSRIEAESSNPHTLNLLRYLDAIGCSLTELDRELNRPADPLEEEVARDDQLLENSAGYREVYRRLFREVGYDSANRQALAPVLDQLARIEARLKKLEDKDEKGTQGAAP